MSSKIYPLACDPGIQKDGTPAASKKWTDGEWVRFQRGVPKKMGGWSRLQPQYGNVNGVYGSDTIGQPANYTYYTWNAYHEYQPREVIFRYYNNSNYLFTGCTSSYKFNNTITDSTTGLQIWYSGNNTENTPWKMPLSMTYTYDTTSSNSKIGSASSAVTLTLINNDGNITYAKNSYVTNNTVTTLIFQNLTGIGPYSAYYTENTRWVFETGYSSITYPSQIIFTGTSVKTDTKAKTELTYLSQTSLALFAIPLYDLDSIKTTYVTENFTVKWKTTNTTNVINVYPVVYVTSMDGYITDQTTDVGQDYALSIGNVQPLYQLSISGNPKGAGMGQYPGFSSTSSTGDGKEYGPAAVLPTNAADGKSGTGQQYFPSNKVQYIWSTDSVFCSGGVLSLEPFTFFYNFHPWNWDTRMPSLVNGMVAHTYPSMEVYTTNTTPTKSTTPTQQTSGSGTVPDENYTTIIKEFTQIADSKIVFGAKIRGGTVSPSALFWSLNTLVRCYYVGTSSVDFQYDTIADNLSILSSRCVVEVNGVFYWIGENSFYIYNGVVDTLPNDTNLNYFFNNVDRDKAQRIWGTKNEKYNEVIWHYPNKNLDGYNGECNAVLIFNYTQSAQCWYNSSFPIANSSSTVTTAGRVCGIHTSDFNYPIWVDSWPATDYTPNSTSTGSYWFTWLHENTNDMTIPGLIAVTQDNDSNFQTPPISYPITSSISSREMTLAGIGPDNNWGGIDRWLRLTRIEPDLIQTGDITLSFLTKKFSQDYQQEYSFLNSTNPLILANDPAGVCYIQELLYDQGTTTSFNLNMNGSYVSGGVATFPYPRLITVNNYSYFYTSSSSTNTSFSIYITITGTYSGKTKTEIITTKSNSIIGASNTGTSKLIYDTITSVVLTYDTIAATMDHKCSFVLGVGTQIPTGSETGNNEFKRLCNFYTDVNVHARRIVLKFIQSGIGKNFELGQFLMHFDAGDGHQ